MNIEVWGPGLWEIIHTSSFRYKSIKITPIIKKQYIIFYTSLQELIPCDKCKEHYTDYLQKYPIKNYINSYNKIITWVNNFHNSVNSKIGKKVYSLTDSKKNILIFIII